MDLGCMNVIDDLTLNISAADAETCSRLESSLYSFARGPLVNELDRILDQEDTGEALELDSLTVDIGEVGYDTALDDILEKLPDAFCRSFSKAVFKRRSAPVMRLLSDVYRQKLPMRDTFNLDKLFEHLAEAWLAENPHKKYSSLAVAEYIIKAMMREHPHVDARQIASSVYQRLKDMDAPVKKTVAEVNLQNDVCDSGIVLLAAYIPMLLGRFKLVAGSVFTSDDARLKALALLRYAVFGEYRIPPKFGLLSNFLCGFDRNFAPEKMPELTDEEKAIVDSLLDAVVKNWGAIGSTSANGLRTSFLIRQGKVSEEDGALQLNVAGSAFDMLLDKLPWGYAMVKLPWQKQKIEVKWR